MRKLMLALAAAATLLCAASLPSTRAEAMPIGAASSVQAAVQDIAPVQNVWWYGGWGYGILASALWIFMHGSPNRRAGGRQLQSVLYQFLNGQ